MLLLAEGVLAKQSYSEFSTYASQNKIVLDGKTVHPWIDTDIIFHIDNALVCGIQVRVLKWVPAKDMYLRSK